MLRAGVPLTVSAEDETRVLTSGFIYRRIGIHCVLEGDDVNAEMNIGSQRPASATRRKFCNF
jgi:hypothetical protein